MLRNVHASKSHRSPHGCKTKRSSYAGRSYKLTTTISSRILRAIHRPLRAAAIRARTLISAFFSRLFSTGYPRRPGGRRAGKRADNFAKSKIDHKAKRKPETEAEEPSILLTTRSRARVQLLRFATLYLEKNPHIATTNPVSSVAMALINANPEASIPKPYLVSLVKHERALILEVAALQAAKGAAKAAIIKTDAILNRQARTLGLTVKRMSMGATATKYKLIQNTGRSPSIKTLVAAIALEISKSNPNYANALRMMSNSSPEIQENGKKMKSEIHNKSIEEAKALAGITSKRK